MSCEEVWLLGADNLFARLGWSQCAVSWADAFVIGCITAIVLATIGGVAFAVRQGLERLARKFTRPSQ